jgi:predicted nucleic acid-binding protein
VIAVDTSVVVGAVSPWHDRHDVCRAVLDNGPAIVGHALVEAFSVLTRLPAPFRVRAELASQLLVENFPDPPLMLDSAQIVHFLRELPRWRVRGGAVYDALIAATVSEFGATLVTLDARALGTYRAVGADVRSLDQVT